MPLLPPRNPPSGAAAFDALVPVQVDLDLAEVTRLLRRGIDFLRGLGQRYLGQAYGSRGRLWWDRGNRRRRRRRGPRRRGIVV